jgi:hypothetical protein
MYIPSYGGISGTIHFTVRRPYITAIIVAITTIFWLFPVDNTPPSPRPPKPPAFAMQEPGEK